MAHVQTVLGAIEPDRLGFTLRLREVGVAESDIEAMTVANPRRLLTVG